MNKLETSIGIVLQELKQKLSVTTWESRRQYYNKMLKLAYSMGINEACQKLYDCYIADDNDSKGRRKMRIHCVKLLDAIAGTKAADKQGKFYNEQPLPGDEETQKYFNNQQHPMEKCPIDYLIVKAGIEMRYLNHTESTTGQYRHAWTDIRRYFYRKGFHHYDEPLLKRFICEIRMLRNNSTMQEWKWKINRKAAYVLIETMNTGKFQWGIIKEDKDCISIEIEPIRNRYLEALKHRNLSKATIYLHDYVFRKLISFLGIKTANNLFTLSQRNVQRVIIYFAGICNRRSMSTILPILRSILLSLHTSGFIDKNLSGIVMSGFVQKGSVACYISKKDQTLLLKQIERESKRTKAIILLLLKLGLRESDIINLTFQEIDWRNDKIRLVQKKTGTPLVLPLLTDVGNALMDYILYERPKRDDRYPYIFLRKQAPYRKLTTLYPTCSKLLKKLEIKPVNGKAAGSRIFRYTTVYRLLAAKTPHQIITGTLGHVSRESDKPYISMEESMLRLCALDLSAIGRVSLKGDC